MTRLATSLLLLSASVAFAAPAQLNLVSRGSLTVPAAGTAAPGGLDTLVPGHAEVDLHAFLTGGPTAGHPLPTQVGDAPSAGISLLNPGFSGFDALDHADQRLAGTGVYTNTQFSLEPPDQGLCVGNGFVVETVNTAFAIYDGKGALLAGPVPANQFFGVVPEIDRVTGVFGDFTSDPRCIYDWTSDRFLITILQLDVDPATGGFTGPSHVFIAVSRTGNPTGAWDSFSLDVTNDGSNGTPSHPNCPCFGDQPLLGFDENAIFITTNEFPTLAAGFNGAQVYGIGKDAFGGGGSVVLFDNLSLEEGTAYSIQPASTPPGGKFEKAKRGTEFFASALDFTGPLDDRIAVWAMTGTKSLNSNKPKVDFGYRIVKTLTYGNPTAGTQKDGPTPLRDALNALGFDEKLEQLESNDDRMQQTVYTDGTLWASLPTVVKPKGDSTFRAGVLWFRIETSVEDHGVKAKLKRQAYLARAGADLLFPSVAVNPSGNGAIAFTITGPSMFPSAGYALLDDDGTGPIHIAGTGAAPEDGFTGYTAFGGDGNARWGDYSAAVAGPDGSIWIANEYITPRPRTVNANWGTFISRLQVKGGDGHHGHDD
jgi:hypothetical protein